MEKKILEYYRECLDAEEKAERERDMDKKSVRKREVYQYCFAQVMCLEELMTKLDIDFDDDDDE
jgi:hypothetical protein